MAKVLASSHYRPLSMPRLHERVVQQIARQIIGSHMQPGTLLPTEITLAEQFGVSRTVIREAVRILANTGLVSVKQGSGMQVQPPERWNQLDPLVLLEQLRSGESQAILADLLDLRQVIEVEIAGLAALRRTPEDVNMLRRAIEAMHAVLDDPVAYTRLDGEFHEAIMGAARSRLLSQALRQAGQAFFIMRLISSQIPQGPATSLADHQAISSAIAEGNQERAREAMRQHILRFQGDIQASLTHGLAHDVIDRALDLL